jgi:hypothetical protein
MPSKTPAGGVLPNRTHRILGLALVVWVVLALVAPIAADAGARRGPSATAGAGSPQISWTACGPQLECASVPVPLDWRHPGGQRITLSVIRHLAAQAPQVLGLTTRAALAEALGQRSDGRLQLDPEQPR